MTKRLSEEVRAVMSVNLRIRYNRYGDPLDVLMLEASEIERPAPGELLIRMIAAPINPSDLIPIRGAYAHRTPLPATPGYEGVGIVEAAGPGVSQEWVGKRVLPLRGEGTWQQFVRVPAKYAIPVPVYVDDWTAAQLYINPLTALLVCSDVLRLGPSHTVAVNACGAAFGRLLVQLSQMRGFRLIAVIRNGRYTEELLALGASEVVDESRETVAEAIHARTDGRGADAVIDMVGGSSGTSLAFALNPGGTYLSVGLLSGIAADWTVIREQAKAEVKLFHLRHWLAGASDSDWQSGFLPWFHWLRDGDVTFSKPEACFRLHDLYEALDHAGRAGTGTGKTMLTFPS